MDYYQDYLFADGVSDEVLESAARTNGGMVNYTLAACTGLTVCPAP
jgi:hypothetical protein